MHVDFISPSILLSNPWRVGLTFVVDKLIKITLIMRNCQRLKALGNTSTVLS